MKKISIKNIYLILIISIGLIGLGIGSTYAMFTSTSNIDNPISLSSNLSSSEDIFESFDITLSSKENKTIKFNITGTNLSDYKYASWYIYDGNDSDLSFYTSIDSTSDIEPNGTLTTTGGTINIKIVNNTSSAISLVIGVSSSKDNIILPDYMKLISGNEEVKTTLVDYITSLYTNASKSTVENNSITYNYASRKNLMNDRLGGTTSSLDGGNIRYYGASPNNYIYFNCSDYSNQSDTTCEKWRIIGVFDGKVKIMRNESIGGYSWDTSSYTYKGYDASYGVNEWSQADAMKLLNPGYESESVGGSLYYNSKSGKCYTSSGNSSTSCNFTNTGIKNDTTRSKIAEVTWNLGGVGYDEYIYSNDIYTYERGTTVYSKDYDGVTRTTKWTGKVAVPYPSDYGYAAEFGTCTSYLNKYNDDNCKNTNWMYSILNNNGDSWLLTPTSDLKDHVMYTYLGYVFSGQTTYYHIYTSASHQIIPTLFLNSDETIVDGTTGSQNNPYKLNRNYLQPID